MENIYGNWIVKFSLKGIVAAPAKVFFTNVNDFYSDRLAYWGIICQKNNPHSDQV